MFSNYILFNSIVNLGILFLEPRVSSRWLASVAIADEAMKNVIDTQRRIMRYTKLVSSRIAIS